MVKTRRQFLKAAGASTVAFGTAAGIAASESNQSDVKRTFNPSDKDEIKSFLKSLNGETKRTQQNVMEDLTQKQQEAAIDYLKVVTVEGPEFETATAMQSPNLSPSDIEPSGFNGYTKKDVTGVYIGRNGYNEKLWTFRQRLSYKWWYKKDVEILSASVRPSINFFPWRYVRTISSDRTDFGDYADSYKQGKFQFCMGGKFGCIQTVLPFIEMRCYSKAGWRYERRGTPGDCSGARC